MPKLYSKCLTNENIRKAIKIVYSHEGSKTAGPDKINKESKISEEIIIKEVKLRLRRYKRTQSRTVEIPKGNGKTRTLTICNLYDRIAQQAVYNIIEARVDMNMSKHSYGFRKGISTKVPVSKICSCVMHSKSTYTVEIDFTKCFDNIPLDKALDSLRELGVHDGKLIKTIKHLMYISREYNGVGLGQGTILGPMLANCYLHKLDKWAENSLDFSDPIHRTRDFNNHKGEIRRWLESRNRKPYAKYYRYADDTIILCHSREEQLWIREMLTEFINKEMDIEINEAKSRLGYNEFNFLGFKIRKNDKISILPAEPKEIKEKIRGFKWNDITEVWRFMKWLSGILNYYDIVNNFSPILEYLTMRMLKRARRRGNDLKKKEGKVIFSYTYQGRTIVIDPYGMRRNTKTSYKEYNMNSGWIKKREYLEIEDDYKNNYNIYRWSLWTKQKGKDPITNEELNITGNDIHHINGNHNDNRIENLILVKEETHKLIHNDVETDNKRLKRYRRTLIKK